MSGKRLGTVQNFTLTSSIQYSAKFGTQTRSIMLSSGSTGVSLGGAYVIIGDSTSLTVGSSNGTLFPAPWLDFFDVSAGQVIALIEASTAHGTLSVTEITG